MGYVASHFGMGLGKIMLIILFSIYGLFLGLRNKMASLSLIILFIYLGSLFSKGNGKIYAVLFFFVIGIYFAKEITKMIRRSTKNKFINFFI